MCLHLCEPPLLPFTPLNGHLIKGFAIFLKTIFFWDTLYNIWISTNMKIQYTFEVAGVLVLILLPSFHDPGVVWFAENNFILLVRHGNNCCIWKIWHKSTLLREGLTRKKKKSVNFHTFGPDPPPLKSVKLKKYFFFHTLTEKYFGLENLFYHL